MDKKPKRPRDVSQLAKMMVDIASGELAPPGHMMPKKNSRHVGGSKGGEARARALSPQERKKIAVKAASTRWTKAKKAVPEKIEHS